MERRTELTVTLYGSFKNMELFNQARQKLTEIESVDVKILAPLGSAVTEQRGEFRMLDCDLPESFPIDLEMGFLRGFLLSDIALGISPKGYLGAASTAEAAIAQTLGVPLFSTEPIDRDLDPGNPDWNDFIDAIEPCPLELLVERIKNPTDSIHLFHHLNNRSEFQNEKIDDLAQFVLSADIIKHRRMGYIVGEVISKRNFLLARLDQIMEQRQQNLVQV